MNEQILQKLLDHLQSTDDVILEQVPEIIQQALKYEKISSYLSASLIMLLLTLVICVGYYFWKHPTLDKYGSREIGSFLGILIPCFVTPLLFVQFCYSIDKLVQIYIAPKYFLINLVTNMKQ